MRNSRLLAAAVALALSSSLLAQAPSPSPPQLTWVRFFSVDPAQGEQFVQYLKKSPGAVFDRLLNEGKLVSWGIVTPFVMSGQDYTHGVWITMNNWATADDVVRIFEESNKKMTAAERQKDMASFTSMVKKAPRDIVLRHQVQSMSAPAPTFKPVYVRLNYFTVKPGMGRDLVAYFREVTEPLWTNLQSRGVIGPWGLSTQELASEDWTHMSWYFTDDLASLDQVRDAIMATPEDVRTARGGRMREMTEPHTFRSEIAYIAHIALARPR